MSVYNPINHCNVDSNVVDYKHIELPTDLGTISPITSYELAHAMAPIPFGDLKTRW
jgi:hypothetical protein